MLTVSTQYDIILMSPSQRGTQQRLSNECECNKLHAANAVYSKPFKGPVHPNYKRPVFIFTLVPPVLSNHDYCSGFLCPGFLFFDTIRVSAVLIVLLTAVKTSAPTCRSRNNGPLARTTRVLRLRLQVL